MILIRIKRSHIDFQRICTAEGIQILTKKPVKGIMILLHKIGGSKESFLHLTKELSERGIESMIFDLRAQGESGGKYCTYGYYEKNDVCVIVDHIKRENAELEIGVWENSLGGAVAVKAMEADQRIDFGIIESTFTALDIIVSDYQKRFTGG